MITLWRCNLKYTGDRFKAHRCVKRACHPGDHVCRCGEVRHNSACCAYGKVRNG